ncbi:hypothetical protein NDU88_003571 [Pleurodeles waltl]|uniref:Uncharacterized protein n=1 Tax=Pleurodeles waltl TaxID=8319 RepID=A0AAV7T717_PLEWA|nr:hypothetical protein NDU88_003571 [Pleurodeles waltl]
MNVVDDQLASGCSDPKLINRVMDYTVCSYTQFLRCEKDEGVEVLMLQGVALDDTAEDGDVLMLGSNDYRPPKCVVELNGISVSMWADSCSPHTLIDKATWARVGEVKLFEAKVNLLGYGGNKIPVVGYFRGEIGFKRKKISSDIYVVERGKCLLGWGEQKSLGVILNPNAEEQVLTGRVKMRNQTNGN